MEDRPEIVVRRDAGSRLAWFLGKPVLVLGCGSLGSWADEMVARACATTVDLVDNRIVKTGLLARQNFAVNDIGAKKATALAVRLLALVTPGGSVRAFDRVGARARRRQERHRCIRRGRSKVAGSGTK